MPLYRGALGANTYPHVDASEVEHARVPGLSRSRFCPLSLSPDAKRARTASTALSSVDGAMSA